MPSFKFLIAVVGLLGVATGWPSTNTSTSVKPGPTVDLGYAVNRASVNQTGNYYQFSNIRYGAPPVGSLRFAAPTPPSTINRTISDSQAPIRCFQAYSSQDLAAANGKAFTGNLSDLIPPDPSETEDCLCLDVVVPVPIFDSAPAKQNREKSKSGSIGAAVLVWIYGGGFYAGYKDGFVAAGLIAQSEANGEGIIFVALNYRLGMFGFLSGPTFQVDGIANAGLLDQRLALEWVQDYIHLFGGDPNRVTLMGESAGGGSTMHQISAYGGLKGKVPFQQAIPQSASYPQIVSSNQQETTFQTVLSTATTLTGNNVTSLSQLRELPTTALVTLNSYIVGFSSYGENPFSPAVDGSFAPALQSHLFLHGQYDKTINVMVGHNIEEAYAFTPQVPNVTAAATALIGVLLPEASANVVSEIINVLYPPIFDGSQNYTDEFGRLEKANGDGYFNCNARYMAEAFSTTSYAYFVTIPPGYHGVDVRYTFFNGDTTTLDNGVPVNATVARKFQSYLTNFVMRGNPNGIGLPEFPGYGDEANVFTIGFDDFGQIQTDPADNNRCDFWQKSLWY